MIKKIYIDCDGVLTDGKLTIDHTGQKQFKQFHTRDVRAIRELIYNGYEVTIVSADDWPGLKHFADKVGAEVLFTRDKKEAIPPGEECIAIGDDAWDVQFLSRAKVAFVPADADYSVTCLDNTTRLTTKGGQGVVAEVCRRLLP